MSAEDFQSRSRKQANPIETNFQPRRPRHRKMRWEKSIESKFPIWIAAISSHGEQWLKQDHNAQASYNLTYIHTTEIHFPGIHFPRKNWGPDKFHWNFSSSKRARHQKRMSKTSPKNKLCHFCFHFLASLSFLSFILPKMLGSFEWEWSLIRVSQFN